MIKTKRVYEVKDSSDGYRVLVDRLWPRGVSKERASVDLWLKEVAPSNELRKWFNHDPAKWSEFQKRYRAELKDNAALGELKKLAAKHKNLTLLYGAHDQKHNQAVVLADLINV